MYNATTCTIIPILLTVFLILLLYYIPWHRVPVGTSDITEKFTAPGLTLTNPPSWFPENSARPYNKKDSETRMYLQKYPIYAPKMPGKYLSPKTSDRLASAYRFWRL